MMKAVFIAFNQANTERIEYMFDQIGIRGFTWWTNVQGRGTTTGEPRMGTHTWPEMNSAAMTVIPDELVDPLLNAIKKLDEINKEVGVRAFVWNIEKTV
jgi:nitrogen regulatory protein PII